MAMLTELTAEAYRTILENLPAAVYLVDRERRIVLWNDGCEKITGYRRHEVIGHCCAEDLLMHCDGNDDSVCGVSCPLLATMHDGHCREADLFLLHKGGHRVPVRVRAVPIRNEEGSIIGACECFDERVPLLPARREEPRLILMGSVDEVTDLPNREGILRRLQTDLRELNTTHIPFGVLCLSIDNLETIRSSNGTNAVNRVLYETARTLAKSIGPGNFVGHWAEGLFMATVTGCCEATLAQSAASLRRLGGLEAVPWWGNRITITLSSGATLARPDDLPEVLAQRVEEALHYSMKSGVNGAVVV